jgi:pimeloyl-ACP methyl ester carboxylesterase
MTDLPVDGIVELEYQVTIFAAEVTGVAGEVTRAPAAGLPARDIEPGTLPEVLPGQALLAERAEEAGMRRALTIPLDELAVRPNAEAPRLEVTVPAPNLDEAQAVLEVDEFGLVRWHFATDSEPSGGPVRGELTQTFSIPVEPIEIDGDPVARERGFLGIGVRKVLHLIRFPVEYVAGRVAEFAVGRWEDKYRPYGLHRASPRYFAGAPDPADAGLFDGAPVLLLIHGTFSVGRSGFAGLAALLPELTRRYDGRVVVFDHPSVHVDPDENVRRLLASLPPAATSVVDVVAHSRGGLVARQLASAGQPAPAVRRIIHVATPNAGTTLASPEHLGDLLDMFSNLVNLFTDEGSGAVASAVIEVVKQIATGALGGLDGLAAMDPAGKALAQLNKAPADPATKVAAITCDYDAAGAAAALRALDFAADRLFGTGNDLVVPTTGVYDAGSYRVDDRLDLTGSTPSIAHSSFLGDPRVHAWLADRLPGS